MTGRRRQAIVAGPAMCGVCADGRPQLADHPSPKQNGEAYPASGAHVTTRVWGFPVITG